MESGVAGKKIKPTKPTRAADSANRSPFMNIDIIKPIENAIETGKQNVEQFIKTGSEVAAKSYEGMVSLSKEQMDAALKAATGAFKGYDGAALFGKDNVDALVAYNSAVTKGFENLVKGLLSFGQKSFEGSVAATKDMLACKTVQEFVDWQSGIARAHFDQFVAEATKISELGVKTAQEATQPISERVHVTVEKFWKQHAA